MLNALTIDVEDYFQVTAFEKSISTKDWDRYPLRVEDNTLKILDLLDEFQVRATFFVLGWVAEKRPLLIKKIQERGHDIACHGFGHQLIYRIGPEKFRDDIRRSKALLEDISGKRITGYRAPSYSITSESLWAIDILVEEGFLYDSSIFPVIHDIYGIPDAKRFPYNIECSSGTIREFPLSTLKLRFLSLETRIPVSGGGYLRLFPAGMIRKAIDHINFREGQPAVLYFHPWEIDPGQPRIKAGLKSRFRHYVNLDRTMGKLRHLLSTLSFVPMSSVLNMGKL